MNNNIHIAIAFDKNYLYPFYALTTSILNSPQTGNIHLHIIATGISLIELNSIKSFIRDKGAEISFYTIDEETVKGIVLNSNWTEAVYYRLLFPGIVSETIGRLLYIDTDTLVLGDLKELYSIDLQNYPVGAVFDNYVKKQPLIGVDDGDYFNSGVMLIDTARWIEQKISEKAFEYLQQYPDRILFVDQCALNAVLAGNWKKLPERFNCMSSIIPEALSNKGKRLFIDDKIILHFTLQRPWNYLCSHPFRKLFIYYFNLSPVGNRSPYVDFSFYKIPRRLKLQVLEWYFDSPLVQNVWKKLKQIIK